MNKFNLKVGQVLGDYRVVSVGEDGAFLTKHALGWYTNDEIQNKFNLKKEKWVPKEGERYWFLDSSLTALNTYNDGCGIDMEQIKVGNVFELESEALSKAEEIKKVLMK